MSTAPKSDEVAEEVQFNAVVQSEDYTNPQAESAIGLDPTRRNKVRQTWSHHVRPDGRLPYA